MTDPLKQILNAKVYDVAIESPLDYAAKLSESLKNDIWLKREDLQPVFSFKLRGAYNKMAHLTAAQLKKGVIAASAGNHAQGVALAAQKLSCHATIVMPTSTPQIKVEAVESRGAKVVLKGDTFNDAKDYAEDLKKKKGLTFIHPYDDDYVIAGQGTIGLEILRQLSKKPDYIFVCVGGGGLLAGVASLIKSLDPKVKVIGVEPVDSDAMTQSLKKNKRVILNQVGRFADGVAVAQVGERNFKLCKKYVDDMITVTTDEICAAIKDVFEETRSILEPSGALSAAGLIKYVHKKKLQNKNLVAINSGANINFHRLRHVSERAELGEGHEAIFAVTIPEEPGSFRKLVQALGQRQITEFNYRRFDPKAAQVFLGVQTSSKNEIKGLEKKIKDKGFKVFNLSDNEMAKLHLRHLVGGKTTDASQEKFFRFEFPERPGALMDFLKHLHKSWDISLFHYRNHGTDYGRVFAGFLVPKAEQGDLSKVLKDLGYVFEDESSNPAVHLFLS